LGQGTIKGTHYSHFSINAKNDVIDFVVADTNLNVQKPILLFCQGSQPVPLFFDFKEQGIVPVALSNFDVKKLNENYHVIVVSMPKTPILVGPENLNYDYNYITDTTNQYSYSRDYLESDFKENYVSRANEVIKFLRKQKWVDKNNIVVAGHSQGAKVAVGIAASNKYVTRLGLFGYNPLGRIDQYIRQARKDAECGKITWQKADSICNDQFEFYQFIQNKDSLVVHPSLKSWESFSLESIDQLIGLEIPVYIAYGSEDIIADFCDLLPIYFIREKKSNYKLKRYPKLEHNFFPEDENGNIDHKNGQWVMVMDEFLTWTNQN